MSDWWIVEVENWDASDNDYQVFPDLVRAREVALEWASASWRLDGTKVRLWVQPLLVSNIADPDWCWWDHNGAARLVEVF